MRTKITDNFACFVSKISFMNSIRVSNSLDRDQAQHLVGPDLGPNCLQRLSADDPISPICKAFLHDFCHLLMFSQNHFFSK